MQTEFFKLTECCDGQLRVLDDSAFRKLKAKVTRVARAHQRPCDNLNHVLLLELVPRDVYRDTFVRDASPVPLLALPACLAQDPLADRQDEPRFLR